MYKLYHDETLVGTFDTEEAAEFQRDALAAKWLEENEDDILQDAGNDYVDENVDFILEGALDAKVDEFEIEEGE
jgi:hypothetical protein